MLSAFRSILGEVMRPPSALRRAATSAESPWVWRTLVGRDDISIAWREEQRQSESGEPNSRGKIEWIMPLPHRLSLRGQHSGALHVDMGNPVFEIFFRDRHETEGFIKPQQLALRR